MKLKNPIAAKRTFLSILDLVPDVEVAIVRANKPEDRKFRDRVVVRLARLDQNLAELRDALSDCNESKGD